jgi:hypothetical protein
MPMRTPRPPSPPSLPRRAARRPPAGQRAHWRRSRTRRSWRRAARRSAGCASGCRTSSTPMTHARITRSTAWRTTCTTARGNPRSRTSCCSSRESPSPPRRRTRRRATCASRAISPMRRCAPRATTRPPTQWTWMCACTTCGRWSRASVSAARAAPTSRACAWRTRISSASASSWRWSTRATSIARAWACSSSIRSCSTRAGRRRWITRIPATAAWPPSRWSGRSIRWTRAGARAWGPAPSTR